MSNSMDTKNNNDNNSDNESSQTSLCPMSTPNDILCTKSNESDCQTLLAFQNKPQLEHESDSITTSTQTKQKQQQQSHHKQLFLNRKDEWQHKISQSEFKYSDLSDDDLLEIMKLQLISDYKLEYFLGNEHALRCVEIRRKYIKQNLEQMDKSDSKSRAMALSDLVDKTFEFEKINGTCCENVIGCVRVPVGVAGPLKLDGDEYYVPLATTEGCLVASTKRGMSALNKSGGVRSTISGDFMTRAPIVRFTDSGFEGFNLVTQAKDWLDKNFELMRAAFERTSKHAKLLKYTCKSIHSDLHIRFEAYTGDAMGMNMCSKGAESALQEMKNAFPTMEIVSLSGNMCTDKKAAAINWINGRGKEVECFAVLPKGIVHSVLKASVDKMIDIYNSKIMQGSAMSGTIGGFNCHAANVVTAIFIATGQDPAQNVSSSNCMLSLKKGQKGSLEMSCKMPSIECGTVGGGMILRDQGYNLQMMGVNGPTPDKSRDGNACTLARIICATVLAAELSLLASLTQNTLVKSHMRYNRCVAL